MRVIGTAGHVDHGKSTLVKALTGIDPDRFAEEKRRGLTIDLGFAWLQLPSGLEVGIVDVPGHERFIRNMLAGVGGVAAALFVVAADEGFMPQSSEHLAILDFLEVRTGVVALTKTDVVDAETVALATEECRERLAGTSLASAPIVAVSSATGSGIDTLIEQLDAVLSTAGDPPDRGRPRLFVDRSFTITGAGTVVTGTLTGGSLQVGQEVEVLPSGQRARIRSLQTHRRTLETVQAGSRVAANLAGLDRAEIRRGDVLVTPGTWQLSDTFAARLRVAADIGRPIAERGAYELYVGSAEVPCRLKLLEGDPPPDGRPAVLQPGSDVLVQIFCMRPLPLEPRDRFIVRDIGRWETVAGGYVLDHFPGRVRRGDPDILARLRSREHAEREALVAQLVAERKAVTPRELAWMAGLGPEALERTLAEMASRRAAVLTTTHVVDAGYVEALHHRAVDILAEHHDRHRLAPGMPREELRAALKLDARIFTDLLERWSHDATMVADKTVVRLPSHGAQLSEIDERSAAQAIAKLHRAGVAPPEIAELGLSDELLRALQRRGDIVLIGPSIAMAADVVEQVERSIVELVGSAGPVTVAQVRDAIGTTRKFAVPLLEYLDATGLTARRGDTRDLGPRGKKMAGADSPD